MSWIDRAKNTKVPNQLGELIQDLKATNANLVSEYGAAQKAAGAFLEEKQEIPSGLV